MKFNPAKCVFGVSAETFLGFMVTQRRIEVNPAQIKVVLETPVPSSKKKLQRLTGRLAVARFTDKLRPFFLTLRGASIPKSDEQLYMYLVVSNYVNGADGPSLKECRLKAPPILPGSSSDCTYKSATPRKLIEQAIRLSFSASNNEAEYEVVLAEQDLALVLEGTKLEIRSDSHLIVEQIQRERVPREENEKADALAGITVTLPIKEAVMLPVYLKVAPSITPEPVCNTSHTDSGWMLNIMKYLQTREWGMDIVGPLPITAAQKKFLLVATDYFSKWVEAEAYANIKDKDVFKFVWKNINLYSTPHYPQNNGQTEATNKTLLNALKKRLEGAKGKWVNDLPGVLWAYRTTSRRPTGATPFALAYGMEAIIPTKIGMPTVKTIVQDQRDNNEELIRQLDLTDKLREDAAIRIASYHQRAIAQYNKRARPRFFRPGSLVLRKVFKNTTEVGARKLQCNWKGSYVVTKAGHSRVYHL
ncbi:hypothetical protein CK203_088988 [Vitis vinifera]|uniref:Integrase catalytic domain-containing protein n=1 Tax=Vitis vinifera TaxID=29760 RepID=A0A438BQT1_VITVI|nr:hypothetical protein CK203_088988 [Vitis vinifera]